MTITIKPGFISPDMTTDEELAVEAAARQSADDALELMHFDMKEPTGHVLRTQSVMSFNTSTRTLSIAPVNTSFDIYVKGTKLTISTTVSLQIPNTSGSYFFYIDGNGDLGYYTSFNPALLTEVACTAYVYWDAISQQATSFGEERHGINMPGDVHGYLHITRGTQLTSGASINYTLGNGTSNTDSQIGITDLQVRDEDIIVNIQHSATPNGSHQQILYPIAKIPVHYRTGAIWSRLTATDYPLVVGSLRTQFNKNVAGSWQLSEATANGKICVSYIFATTNFSEPVIALLGQDEYTDLETAKTLAAWDKISFGDLSAQEMKLLYIVYYETSSAFTNAAKSKIVYIQDVRWSTDRQVSATVYNGTHSNLSGLANDDHSQYHTDARGDVRYYTKSQVDSSLSSNSSGDRDRANHTGTQLASTISDFTSAVQSVTIDAAKIDGGVVSNAEFATLDGITTGVSIQSQLNGKQATGNYITALTGDVTASGPGSVAATLSNTGVVAGTYNQVTVDAKGRVSSGVVNRYVYKTTATQAQTAASYAAITQFVSDSLPVGLYKFSAYIIAQTAATTTGIGFRLGAGTAVLSTISSKWFIAQGADGTAKNFQIDQLAANTNVTSASAITANTNFSSIGDGIFRVTTAGTVQIQFRTEVANTAATVQADSVFIIESV